MRSRKRGKRRSSGAQQPKKGAIAPPDPEGGPSTR